MLKLGNLINILLKKTKKNLLKENALCLSETMGFFFPLVSILKINRFLEVIMIPVGRRCLFHPSLLFLLWTSQWFNNEFHSIFSFTFHCMKKAKGKLAMEISLFFKGFFSFVLLLNINLFGFSLSHSISSSLLLNHIPC